MAEHSFRPAVIGHALARLHGPAADAARVVLLCLLHDTPEARTGDMNYVYKKYNRTDEARAAVAQRATLKHKTARFPAIWQANADWIPDQDHGAVLVRAVQTMLLQCDDDSIRLFPAWPKDWDVRFKLHAPHNTTVEGELKGGKLLSLKVTPPERLKNIVNMIER